MPLKTCLDGNREIVGKEMKSASLAAILARDVYFGEDVMIQCTSHGYKEKPGLPLRE